MDDLRAYAVFARTATAGSMSAAARRLGMTPSAVSQTVRALEARTGVALLRRSTRKLALTEAGERCLPHCLRLLEAGEAAANALEAARDAPTGELRVAAPAGFGTHLSLALAPLLADWPALKLRLILDDRLIDLIDARIDLAVRVGALPDTTWIGRKLCEFEPILCAAPAYVERRGVPAGPDDLPAHDWLTMTGAGSGDAPQPETVELSLSGPEGERRSVEAPIRTSTTTQVALHQLCEEGMGIAVLLYPDVRLALERGMLVRLVPGWRLPSSPVTMVLPRSENDAAKVRAGVAALQRYFSTLPKLGHKTLS